MSWLQEPLWWTFVGLAGSLLHGPSWWTSWSFARTQRKNVRDRRECWRRGFPRGETRGGTLGKGRTHPEPQIRNCYTKAKARRYADFFGLVSTPQGSHTWKHVFPVGKFYFCNSHLAFSPNTQTVPAGLTLHKSLPSSVRTPLDTLLAAQVVNNPDGPLSAPQASQESKFLRPAQLAKGETVYPIVDFVDKIVSSVEDGMLSELGSTKLAVSYGPTMAQWVIAKNRIFHTLLSTGWLTSPEDVSITLHIL